MNTKKEIFNFSKVENFDDHINLSIPNYSGLSELFETFVYEYMPVNGVCVDIGCSTGRFLNSLRKSEGTYVGVDAVDFKDRHEGFVFVNGGIVDYLKTLERADVLISMFALQFLGPSERLAAIVELTRLVNGGACLLLAEKVFIESPKINQLIHRSHIQFKRKGFTDKEILDKDYELMGSMFCKTDKEIDNELSFFGNYWQVWQSYNFKAWCIN
tara:strand:- start:1494 stop:2135 length:642 start_codon:yes stop_codon:yes gene_type:complete